MSQKKFNFGRNDKDSKDLYTNPSFRDQPSSMNFVPVVRVLFTKIISDREPDPHPLEEGIPPQDTDSNPETELQAHLRKSREEADLIAFARCIWQQLKKGDRMIESMIDTLWELVRRLPNSGPLLEPFEFKDLSKRTERLLLFRHPWMDNNERLKALQSIYASSLNELLREDIADLKHLRRRLMKYDQLQMLDSQLLSEIDFILKSARV